MRSGWRILFVGVALLLVLAASLVQTAAAAESYRFVTKWESQGSGDGQFSMPMGIACSADRVYVVDSDNDRVQVFDTAGTFVRAWGGYGTGDGQFSYPFGIAVDSDGNVYVTDGLNNRTQKFSSDGDYLAQWGGPGTGNGQFIIPTGIAVNASGNVYVADYGNFRVQKFTSDGAFLAEWGGLAVHVGIAVNADGSRVYVSDALRSRVQVFDSAGAPLGSFGSFGTGDGQFGSPYFIAVDAAGSVYVCDSTNDRVQKFTSDGDFVTTWGSRGSGDGQFRQPLGIAVDSAGAVYVTDSMNGRVEKFASDAVPVDANFTANVTEGEAPLAVAFTDTSTGDGIANRSWDFGDGSPASDETNPIHTYTAPGNYTVNLTVANAGGPDSEEKVEYITVTQPPITGADRAYYLVSTVPAGAEIYQERIGGTRYHQGNTSAGPLNVTLCLTCTPVRRIVATLPGYLEAAYAITAYPARGETEAVCLTLERGTLAPFPGPHVPATVIQAEDFDTGGEGVAYHDTEPANLGGAYRPSEGVDIETGNGVTDVGWLRSGEYLRYTVDTTIAGDFRLTLRAANPDPGRKSVRVLLDGTPVTEVDLRSTGGWTTYAEFGGIEPFHLSAGRHTVTLAFEGIDRVNLDWLLLAAGMVPAGGGKPYPSAHAVPGRVEAEDYDTGGFSDTTPANEGGAYRNDPVDIETGNGVTNVGWIRPGEYLQYSVDAAAPGTYALSFRVANPRSAMPVAVLVNGDARLLTIPGTGSFGAWQTTALEDVPLVAGRNTVRIETGRAGSFNLDYMEFAIGTPTVTVTPTATAAPPSGTASFMAAPLSAPKGSAVKFTLTPPAGRVVKSAWWSFDAPARLNTWNSRAVNPTFFYPAAGTFSPLVRITYTDGSTETVQRTGYIRAT